MVGDAGLVMDPITACGIGNALQQAELLADAVAPGKDGNATLDRALAAYYRRRHAALRPLYDFAVGRASFRPDLATSLLFPGGTPRRDQPLPGRR